MAAYLGSGDKSGVDQLYSLRNQFWVGNYGSAIEEADNIAPSDESQSIEITCYKLRSEIEMGIYDASRSTGGGSTAVHAVHMLGAVSAGALPVEEAKASLSTLLEDPNSAGNSTLQIVAATIFSRSGDWQNALVALKTGATLEHLALRLQILLQMDRADKAEATLREMQKQDDDSTLTELCKGWLNCYRGGAQAAEQALYAFQELAAKFGRTTLLLNNLAACHMHLKNYAEAWRQLEEARENHSAHAETLINSIVCAQHMPSNNQEEQLYEELKKLRPDHPWCQTDARLSASFEAEAANFETKQ